MHAWDEPAETLLDWARRAGAQLVMPRLGEPVEPAHADRVEPWWRAVETVSAKIEADVTPLQKAVPWPLD